MTMTKIPKIYTLNQTGVESRTVSKQGVEMGTGTLRQSMLRATFRIRNLPYNSSIPQISRSFALLNAFSGKWGSHWSTDQQDAIDELVACTISYTKQSRYVSLDKENSDYAVNGEIIWGSEWYRANYWLLQHRPINRWTPVIRQRVAGSNSVYSSVPSLPA